MTWFGSVFQTEQVSGPKEYFRELVLASGWMKSEVDLDERRYSISDSTAFTVPSTPPKTTAP